MKQAVRVHTLTSGEVASAAGITYRQLDHWTTNQVIPPDYTGWVGGDGKPTQHRGSGNRRRYHWSVIEPLRAAARVQGFLHLACGDRHGANMEFLAKVFVAAEQGATGVQLGGVTINWEAT